MRTQSSVSEKRRRGRTRLRILIAAGCVVAVVLLTILIDTAVYYNKVHTGVSVSGVSLAGLTRDEATASLNRLVDEAQDNAIVLSSGEKTWTVMPGDVGTTIDVASAVSAAMDTTRDSNFVVDLARRLKLYFADKDIQLGGTVDSTLMDGIVAEVAQELDLPPVNAGLAVDGTEITVVEGQKGRVVDQDTLRAQLKTVLFSLHATELPVPMVVKEPDVQADDSQVALEQAKKMISGSLTLTDGEQTWSINSEQIAAYLDFSAEQQNGVSTLVPYLSAEKMSPFFEQIAAKVATNPKDATFDSDGTKAWVVDGVAGKALDAEATAAALTTAALGATGRTADVVVKITEPDRTTEEANAMGIKDRLAGYTTEPYAGTASRQVNVRITTEYASDVILAPGEEYNFDKQVGPRTAERGYKLAKGIVGQGELADVLGGGICQVSTTLFNAVFDAGLKVTERWNHSLYIDHYPSGRDATVTDTSKNLRFVNDTAHYIWIRGVSDGVTTTFNIYGTYDGRKVTKASFSGWSWGDKRTDVTVLNKSLGPGTSVVKITGQQGRSCSVKRTITYADGTSKTETFSSYYPMIQRKIEVGPTTTTTTIPTSTSTTVPGATTSLTIGF